MSLVRRQLIAVFRSTHPFPIPSTASLQRLLSTAISSSPGHQFAIKEYLTTTLQFSPTQALRASKHLSHLKSASNPDAVASFLTDLGLTTSDIAAAASCCPRILCASVQKTLTPRVASLRDLAWSESQIARLISIAPFPFCCYRHLGRKLQFWLPLFGSVDSLLKSLRMNSNLLGSDLERVVKPNLKLLQNQCNLSAPEIATRLTRLLITNPEQVKTKVKRAEELGFPLRSKMFQYALLMTSCHSSEILQSKMEFYKMALGWSEAQVLAAVSKMPMLLSHSTKRIERVWEFLIKEVGLELEYVVRNPGLLCFSVEWRMMPRHHTMKVLRGKGLPEGGRKFYSAMVLTDKKFLEKFINPYKETIPGLADAYAAAFAGKVPKVEL